MEFNLKVTAIGFAPNDPVVFIVVVELLSCRLLVLLYCVLLYCVKSVTTATNVHDKNKNFESKHEFWKIVSF